LRYVEVLLKRLELIRELFPGVRETRVLIDQADPALAEGQLKDLQAAATTLDVKLHVLNPALTPNWRPPLQSRGSGGSAS